MDDRITKLSDVQKQCLRLAADGHSSKEIAPLVGLTHQTVDQYLHRARQVLGATNRREAARIFTEIERATPFKGFELKPVIIENPSDPGISEEPIEQQRATPKLLDLPPIGGPLNDLMLNQRLIEIGKITLFLTITVLVVIILIAGFLSAFPR